MEGYKATITPESAFITPIKGDTLFGQMCWGIVHLYGSERLRTLLEGYTDGRPFLIVSDPFAPGYLPKPTMPSALLGEDADKKKENRKRVWIRPEDAAKGDYLRAYTSDEIGFEIQRNISIHNSVNYATSRTGRGFDPFALERLTYPPMEIYLLIDEARFTKEECEAVLKQVGEHGYGKKASSGHGRFGLNAFEKTVLKQTGHAFMALAPIVLEESDANRLYYDTFVRFGRHGANNANANPFKKPVLMAQTGAVLQYTESSTRSFAGKGLNGVSPTHPETVHQGYAPLVAIGVQ